jgi:hypothetical protein
MRRSLIVLLLLMPLLSGCGAAAPPDDVDEPEDLLLLMVYAQRYLEKLHLAGEAENWPLADLYAHELEEVGEAMRDGGYVVHETALEDLARGAFLPAVERAELAIDEEDPAAFAEAFRGIVTSCNSCHAASGYEAIRIIVPEDFSRPYPSQAFDN